MCTNVTQDIYRFKLLKGNYISISLKAFLLSKKNLYCNFKYSKGGDPMSSDMDIVSINRSLNYQLNRKVI